MEVSIDSKDIEKMITKATESVVNVKVGRLASKVDNIENMLLEIKNIIVGSEEFNQTGMKKEHDEMYNAYRNMKFVIDNIKWFVGIMGISNVTSAVLSIISILSKNN